MKLLSTAILCAAMFFTWSSHTAGAAKKPSNPIPALSRRVERLEYQLQAQQEARNRQAEAFDAAVREIELMNGALILVITVGGIGATLLTLNWVRDYAKTQMDRKIDEAVRVAGSATFAREAAALREEYDEKFAKAYEDYRALIRREGGS
jgi:hypothetical protein